MDSLLFLDYMQVFARKRRKIEPRRELFDAYDDVKFKERFRLSKTTVHKLLDEARSLYRLCGYVKYTNSVHMHVTIP